MEEAAEGSGIKLGPEAQGVLGIGSSPKANINALPGAVQQQKKIYQNKIQETLKEKAEKQKPLKEQLTAMETKRDAFEGKTPVHEKIAPAPKFEPKQISDGFSLMLGLASFAGMASRQPLTAALNNMTGMMQGLQEGNKENFEHAYKNWESSFKVAEAKYKDELNAYQKILGDMNKSIDQKMREIRNVGLEYDNKLVVAEAQSENPDHIIKLTESLGKLSHQMATEAQGWQRIHLAQEKEQRAKTASASGRVEGNEFGKAAYDKLIRAGLTVPKARRGEIDWDSLNRIGEEDSHTGGNLAAGQIEAKVLKSSYAQVSKKKEMLNATMNSFHNNIRTWEEIASGHAPSIGGEKLQEMLSATKKIDLSGVAAEIDKANQNPTASSTDAQMTDSVIANNIRLAVSRQFSDPQTVAYMTAAFAVAMDYSRILSSGGQSGAAVTEGARNEALELVQKGLNAKGRKALIGTMESEAEGQIKGSTDQEKAILKRISEISNPPKSGGSSGGWSAKKVE
jgi:hypothetical protein